MTNEILIGIATLVGGEILLHFLFFLLSKFIGKGKKDKVDRTSILKGVLERLFVVVSFFYGFSSALTLLGALKIATRIKDTEDKVSNDFFVIGNLISILFGIAYYIVLRELIDIEL
ncbi:MAG: hypothetical protein MUC38_00230 [Cyclobacteriaceae bacterium]|jgi:hypothetical protein|nr:hypothetical protein [Cyclobacteriaceae bacterium]